MNFSASRSPIAAAGEFALILTTKKDPGTGSFFFVDYGVNEGGRTLDLQGHNLAL